MNLEAIQGRTGYLLANPQKFIKAEYEMEILPLVYRELDILSSGIELMQKNEFLIKHLDESQKNDLAVQIGLCTSAGGWSGFGVGAVAGGSSLLVNSELTKRVLTITAKSFGAIGAGGLVVTYYVINCVLEKSARELDTYERDAKFVALQMEQVIQRRQIEIQGCAIGAHLQLTSRQERQIAQLQVQQRQQQQLLLDREHEVTDLKDEQQRELETLKNEQQQKLDVLKDDQQQKLDALKDDQQQKIDDLSKQMQSLMNTIQGAG